MSGLGGCRDEAADDAEYLKRHPTAQHVVDCIIQSCAANRPDDVPGFITTMARAGLLRRMVALTKRLVCWLGHCGCWAALPVGCRRVRSPCGRSDLCGVGASSAVMSRASGFTVEEVSKHNTAEDAWVAVNGKVCQGVARRGKGGGTNVALTRNFCGRSFLSREKVYDVTHFFEEHPGGADILRQVIGTDATAKFQAVHSYVNPDNRLKVGQHTADVGNLF